MHNQGTFWATYQATKSQSKCFSAFHLSHQHWPSIKLHQQGSRWGFGVGFWAIVLPGIRSSIYFPDIFQYKLSGNEHFRQNMQNFVGKCLILSGN
jgi:hypothetical protein